MSLPENWKTILKQPVLVHFTTVMADGTPQRSPVWVDVDSDRTWAASGVELTSSTGEPTGLELPAGPEHRSPGLGGVLSVGDEVFVQGSATPTHRRLDDHPAPLRSTAASPDANELTVLFGDYVGLGGVGLRQASEQGRPWDAG